MSNVFRLSALLLLCLTVSVPALAHDAEGPTIEVFSGQIWQGQPFRALGDDLDAEEDVVLEISSFDEVYPLGMVRTDIQGHFMADVVAPAEMRDGYAELRATSLSGSLATTWVLVGPEPDLGVGLPGSRAPSDQAPIWTDPSVLVLGAFVGGAGAALLYLFLRRAARRPAHAKASVPAKAPRLVPRKSKAKARRT